MSINELSPSDVTRLMAEDAIYLIDVREQGEYNEAHIKGANLIPLSGFDPRTLPDPNGKRIVFHCGVGGRSARAVQACQMAGVSIDTHMKGGIKAWIEAGLPIEQ